MHSLFHNSRRVILFSLILLATLELLLFLTNFTHGTYLLGWDNVMPEFAFKENLIRSLFGVWQEHRGAGLYDGMSHIANLPHTLTLLLLSLALPQNILRYAYIFGMHLFGGIGMFLLLRSLFPNKTGFSSWIVSITGSIFYLLNLATIQMFYMPLEAFAAHFAALPWLALTLREYLISGKRSWFLGFLAVTLFLSPQYFVTTLFFPICLLVGALLFVFWIQHLHLRDEIPIHRRVMLAGLGFAVINLFWLLPYVVGLPHNAPVIAGAKINEMSSGEIFARNQAFGDLYHVLTLQGFEINYEDIGLNGTFGFALSAWRTYVRYPIVIVAMLILAGTTLWGLISSVRKNERRLLPFTLITIAAFLMLGNDIPLLSNLTALLRDRLPVIGEAFRFPFTKFSLLFAFGYSIFLAYGVTTIISHIRLSYWKQMLGPMIITVIILISLPAFDGNFIYKNLRIPLPSDYPELFTYMQKENPNGRIALFPQPAYWSWKNYHFGYRGSGFLWYGLPQPVMDRAFDPWSSENENYYWELSRAVYSKDPRALEAVFKKYGITYIIIDENLESVSDNRALFVDVTNNLLAHIPGVRYKTKIGKITVFKYLNSTISSYVSLTDHVPGVATSYHWTDNDVAYPILGTYRLDSSTPTTLLPFRSLFTKRSTDEREFTVTEDSDHFRIAVPVPNLIPEQFVPTHFPTHSGGSISVETDIVKTADSVTASVSKADNLAYDSTTTESLLAGNVSTCGLLREGTSKATQETMGNASWLHIVTQDQRSCLTLSVPSLSHQEGYLVAVKNRHLTGRPMLISFINDTAKHIELETYLPQNSDWNTSYYILPPLAGDGLGYTIFLANDAIGRYPSINDLESLRIYRFPYSQLTELMYTDAQVISLTPVSWDSSLFSVSHPNPMLYTINLSRQMFDETTLTLSQSFNPGWYAFALNNHYPFLKPLTGHTQINNWANGWTLPSGLTTKTIIIVFLPQLLEFVGFLLLPIPFIVAKKISQSK